MFTRNSIKWMLVFSLLTVVALGSFNLTGTALAAGGENSITNANAYISFLDNLRTMGQEQAGVAAAQRARDKAVFDHTGDLEALREKAAVATRTNNRPTIADANGYISHLDQLRTMGSSWQTDANAYISQLDQLRQQGHDAAQVNPSQFASR